MKMAEIYNENSKEYYKQETAQEYVFITADEYKDTELIEMEKSLFELLDFKVNYSTTMHFLKFYAYFLQVPENILVKASFVADLLLLVYQSVMYRPSVLASCCLFFAC